LRRVARAALWGLAAAHVVDAIVLRRRRAQVAVLSLPGAPPDLGGKVRVVAAEGVELDDDTLAAAAYEMEMDGAQVVDLLPGDLPADRALRALRRVAPERLAGDIVYAPGGAHEAIVLHPSLVDRMADHAPGSAPLGRYAMVRETIRAQRHAPLASVVRVAPWLRASPLDPAGRWEELRALTLSTQQYVSLPPVMVAAQLAHLAALTAGLLVAPGPAAAALLAWSVEPLVVFSGTSHDALADDEDLGVELIRNRNGDGNEDRDGNGVRAGEPVGLQPPNLLRDSLLRLPRAWVDTLRVAAAGRAESKAAADRRRADPPPAPPAWERFFEPDRDTCPWCGSRSLTGRLDTVDVFQHKPGEFHVDECRDCGHMFQNPAPTPAGLDYYYSEFYEGYGEETWEIVFDSGVKHNRRRIQAIARVAEPKSWLDVGTGHGHFCLTARQRWPEARFDGVDMSETVEEALRRGRIDVAHRGLFIELADDLPGPYDVVSMHHYLEHTYDPRAELAAAARVLAPGGHLMIEVPDPATPWSRRLGPRWFAWAMPQHLHFVRCEELVKHLEEQGFQVMSVERAGATMGADLVVSVGLGVQQLVPSPHQPWLPAPSLGRRAAHMAALTAAVPLSLVAAVGDVVKDARPAPGRLGNAYRVVARAPGGETTA
jgi:ubiquinone/menaquinone biosynthesis C-methylase UbiE